MPKSEQVAFDVAALHDALDAERRSRGMSWQQVAAAIGNVSLSTLTGMRERALEGDGVLQMLRWLRRPPEHFVRGTGPAMRAAATPLPEVGPGQILRFDAIRMHEALDARRIAQGLTWTELARVLEEPGPGLARLAKGGRVRMSQAVKIAAWLAQSISSFTRIASR